jgi:photosystem II stability/assembly factor-like uncharacterized protein
MAKAGLLFVGTDDGLVLFSNPNEIGRWLRIGQPFRGTAVTAVWAAPENPLLVLAAVAGQGVQRSEDGGQSWQALFDWPAAAIAGAANGPGFIRTDDGVYESPDRGANWQLQPLDGPAGPLAVAGGAAATVGGAQVFARNAAGVWAPFGAALPGRAASLALLPHLPGELRAVLGETLYACASADAAWVAQTGAPVARGALATLPGKSSALLLALADGGIARSDDLGASWAQTFPEGAIDVIMPASYHVDVAFAGGEAGALLMTSDRGRSWQEVKAGLPPIRSIAAARLL